MLHVMGDIMDHNKLDMVDEKHPLKTDLISQWRLTDEIEYSDATPSPPASIMLISLLSYDRLPFF